MDQNHASKCLEDEEAMRKKMRQTKLPIPHKIVVGALAGIVGTTTIYPLDMIKTRLQTSQGSLKGPVDAFKRILASEGAKGFYKGLGANLVGVTPEKAIKLAANEFFREAFEEQDGSIKLQYEMLAGASAGSCQVVATTPMELVKIRMQMQATLPVAERQSTVEVVRNLGIKGCYKGFAATLLRDVPFSFIYFPLYANIKKMMADSKGDTSMGSILTAGFIAASLSAGMVTPLDVIKTRLQVSGGIEKYGNITGAFQLILKEEGPAAFFKGLAPRMIVVGPLFAIAQLSFEKMKEYLIRSGRL